MIPIKISSLKTSEYWPTHIVIHHTAEDKVPDTFKFDNPKFQTGLLQKEKYQKTKDPNSKYHIIIERIGDDFYPIMSQPLFTKCEWDDIPKEYHSAVHIAILGNMDNDIPMTRLYLILGFRVLFPLTRMFRLKVDRIVFHRDISNQNITCPGEMMDINKVRMYARRFRKQQSLYRKSSS